jgi:outer membrane protein assembly factor BamB
MLGIHINKQMNGALSVCFFILIFSGCKKPQPINYEVPTELHNGFLTLNEGLFQQNNSTLTWYKIDEQKVYPNFFEKKNELDLGDTGNDIKVYGDKIYIVVNNSHILHVLDKKTGKLLNQITLSNNNSGSSPRHITFSGANAYICAFDGSIFKIDTATISIQQIVLAGTNPEDIIAYNGKLFVSNSGGLNYPIMDSTVSIFDIASMQEIIRVKVGKNPGEMVLDDFGSLWVSVRGDESLNEGKLVKLNPSTNQIEASFDIDCAGITSGNGLLYIANYNYNTQTSNVMSLNPQTNQMVNEKFIDGSQFSTIYGIHYIEVSGQGILLTNDAKSYINQGKVMAFDLQGNLLFNYTSGLNPHSSVYLP